MGEPTMSSPEARAEFREQVLDYAREWLTHSIPMGDATGLNRWAGEAQSMVGLLIHSLEIAHQQLGGVS